MINLKLENPVYNAFMLFMQTTSAIQKLSDSTLYKRVGLSTSKYAVLQILSISNGTMTPSEIARWILRERHNITTLVSRMKREGLVEVEPSTTDRRSVNIIITEKGKKKLEAAQPVAREIVERVMTSMGERNINSLTKSLGILRQNAHNGMSDLFKSSTKWGV